MAHHCRLLLAEDNIDDQFMFRRAVKLHAAGIELVVVGDGEQAKKVLSSGRDATGRAFVPNLLVTDLKMPYCDGIELIAWTRARPLFTKLCIIAFSTSDECTDVEKAYAVTADHYFQKPSSLTGYAEVVRLIKRYCEDPSASVESEYLRARTPARRIA